MTTATADRLAEVQATLTALNASILSLAGKTRQSVSFGDQSYSIADIEKLVRVRDRYRQEEKTIEGQLFGTKRRTIKVSFPAC